MKARKNQEMSFGAEQPVVTDGAAATVPATESNKEGRFKVKFWGGAKKVGRALLIAAVLGVAVSVVLYIWGKFPGFNNVIDKYILSHLPKRNNIEVALPVSEDKLVSITYPGVDRNLDAVAGFYSLPENYVGFYIDENGQLREAKLTEITDSAKKGKNVTNYQSADGTAYTDFIGVQSDYAKFIIEMQKLKEGVKNNDGTYTKALEAINYQVPNLYLLSAGYELYCEDQTIMQQAKLATPLADGSKIYSIPSHLVSKFFGITPEARDMLNKYKELEGQIINMQQIYSTGNTSIAYSDSLDTTNTMDAPNAEPNADLGYGDGYDEAQARSGR